MTAFVAKEEEEVFGLRSWPVAYSEVDGQDT